MLSFNRKIPSSTLANHTLKANGPAASSPARQHIWLLLILSVISFRGFFTLVKNGASALSRHPRNRILLEERDQALLFC